MPGTAAALGQRYGIDTSTPLGNLTGGAYYLGEQLKRFGGNARLAVAAYNAGPGAVAKYNGVPPYAETQRYVQNVIGDQSQVPLGASDSPVQGFGGPGASPVAPTNRLAPELLSSILNQNRAINGLPSVDLPALAPQMSGKEPGATSLPQVRTTGKAPRVSGSTLKFIEHFAAPFGLTITATTNGTHAKNSYHYKSRAVDFGGDPNRMAALAHYALDHAGTWSEFIYTGPGNPGYSILKGQVIPNSQLPKDLFTQHENHVHLAR
jgi:hypothetical protein